MCGSIWDIAEGIKGFIPLLRVLITQLEIKLFYCGVAIQYLNDYVMETTPILGVHKCWFEFNDFIQ